MKVNTESTILSERGIEFTEKQYKAKYVFESVLKTKAGTYTEFPVAIFYTEEPHPEGSNYFGLYPDGYGRWMITNGITAIEGEYTGIVVKNEIYYSRFRHDYRSVNGNAIDGGRDYTRLVGNNIKTVTFKVDKDKLVVFQNEDSIKASAV